MCICELILFCTIFFYDFSGFDFVVFDFLSLYDYFWVCALICS